MKTVGPETLFSPVVDGGWLLVRVDAGGACCTKWTTRPSTPVKATEQNLGPKLRN